MAFPIPLTFLERNWAEGKIFFFPQDWNRAKLK